MECLEMLCNEVVYAKLTVRFVNKNQDLESNLKFDQELAVVTSRWCMGVGVDVHLLTGRTLCLGEKWGGRGQVGSTSAPQQTPAGEWEHQMNCHCHFGKCLSHLLVGMIGPPGH